MDLPQRFTGDEHYYEMEETFLEELENLPSIYSAGIIMQLDRLAEEMYEQNKLSKPSKRFGLIAGVVQLKSPLFFSVEYLNSKYKLKLRCFLDGFPHPSGANARKNIQFKKNKKKMKLILKRK